MNENKTIEKIIEFFNDNGELFIECMEDLDRYSGYLGDDRYYEMEFINEFYNNVEPLEILQRAFFGRDDDYYTDGSGNKVYGEFNPNKDFFYFNGYGNFVSTNYKDYTHHLDEHAIRAMSDYRNYIYAIDDNDELSALFDKLAED